MTAATERQQALAGLLRGVADDVATCQDLLDLLEEQFDAALRHQSARLAALAERVTAALEAMETRRGQRVAQAGLLLGPQASMDGVIARLKGATREQLAADWARLEQMVLECKRRSQRNGALLTEQYAIMQRVLHGEEQIYAPA